MQSRTYHCKQFVTKSKPVSAYWFTILSINDRTPEQGKGPWRTQV